MLEDGIGYVHDGRGDRPTAPTRRARPTRFEHDAIDAVERCPGECIYVEPDAPAGAPDDDIIDAEDPSSA